MKIGICYFDTYELEEAQEYLWKAIHNKRIHSDFMDIDIGKANYYLGKIHEYEDDYEEGLDSYKKAFRILRKFHDEDHEDIVEIQKSINRVSQKLNDED